MSLQGTARIARLPIGRPSNGIRLAHPVRDVLLAMQHAPDIEVIGPIDVKHKLWIFPKLKRTQSRQVQFMRVPGRTGGRIAADSNVGLFQRIYESQGRCWSTLAHIICDGLVDIPVRLLTREDGLRFQLRVRDPVGRRTRARNPSKKAASAGAAGKDEAPASSSPRKRMRS